MRSLIEPLFEAALEAVLAGAASGALPAALLVASTGRSRDRRERVRRATTGSESRRRGLC
jgi:hypothetical protein